MLGEIILVNLKFIKIFLILFGGLKFYAYICNRKQMNKQYEKVSVRTRSTDFIFNIGVLVDKWFHNIKTEKPYTTYRSSSVKENERTITDNI